MSEIIENPKETYTTSIRLPFIDWLRGVCILLMVIYHFCYDLDLFGYIETAFGKGGWIPFRYVIVLGFLSLVGVSLVLVHHKQVKWRNMNKRSVQLLVACIFVSASGYFIAANKITVFGILQFILVASWLVLPLLKRPVTALILGVIILIAGHLFKFEVFNSVWLHWIGMMETIRPALDYVPVVPWVGAVLIGVYIGHWFLTEQGQAVGKISFSQHSNSFIKNTNNVLEKMGQHSLVIYLVHQPIMFGLFYGLKYIS